MDFESDDPSYADMEELFVNNEKLSRISAFLSRFNPIRTMRMEGMEIRHSAILSWLLDPRETHGLGDRFLKAFIAEALRDHSHLGKPSALEIIQTDLRDAEIRREWRGIDILINFPSLNWVFVAENKFYSRQHKGQLAKYIGKVDAFFKAQDKNPIVRGIFLTLFDEDPEDGSFAPIRYASICEILQSLLANDTSITEEVAMFLRHYLDIIEDETGIRFQDGAIKEGRKYSKFFKNNSTDVADVHDADQIAKAMTDLLKRFQPHFDAIAEVLPAFIDYGKAEPSS